MLGFNNGFLSSIIVFYLIVDFFDIRKLDEMII